MLDAQQLQQQMALVNGLILQTFASNTRVKRPNIATSIMPT